MKAVLLLTFIVISIFISACGKSKSGAGLVVQKTPLEEEGIFSATMYSVNQKLSTNLSGVVTLSKYGDYLDVRIKLKNGPGGIHMQGLYTGEACPYEDSNGDGFIDIKEAEKNIQRMLIPFDGDISGQSIGSDYFPSDNYAYERSTSYGLMLSDLKPKDRNLKLEGRVIVIHGVAETHSLPDTLSTVGQHSRQKSVPIACGVLSHVTIDPREEESETTPIRVRPRPRPDRPIEPMPIPEVERPRSLWQRLRDRLERWWNRMGGWRRGRHDEDEGEKP